MGIFASSALWLILDAAAKSLIILLATSVVIASSPRASAAKRHLVWLLGILSLLLLPLLSAVLPRWEVLPRWVSYGSGRGASEVVSPAPGPTVTVNVEGSIAMPPAIPATPPSIDLKALPLDTRSIAHRQQIDWAAIILFVWLGGVLITSAPALVGLVSLWRLRRGSERVSERSWLELLQECAGDLGLSRRVALLKSAQRKMPMTWGLFRPRLLLPEEAENWLGERRRVVLLHELAHVKRWDYFTNLLTQVTRALYWFNPLVWLVCRQIVVERERACDDLVLSHSADPAKYAEEILQLASGLESSRPAAFAAIAMARHSHLEGRLVAILDGTRDRAGMSRIAVLLTLALGATTVLAPVAMLSASHSKIAKSPAISKSGMTDIAGEKGSNSTTSANSAYVFGKIHEQELWPHWYNRYFDLDTSALLESHPPGDLVFHLGESDLRVRAGLDMSLINAGPEAWDATADEVYDAIDKVPRKDRTRLGGDESKRNWFFKTLEGAAGVLQVVPHQRNDGSVLMRYKLVRPRILEFAPTRTIILRDNRYLDLKDGTMHGVIPSGSPALYLQRAPDLGWCVTLVNAFHYRADREEGIKLWDTMSAEAVGQPSGTAHPGARSGNPFDRRPFYELREDGLPVTVVIPQWGLLQIGGIDSADPDEPAVIVQCKLLKNAPNLVITGQVHDRSGNAVVGADVVLGTPESPAVIGDGGLLESNDRAIKTDATGSFALRNVHRNDHAYVVVVHSLGVGVLSWSDFTRSKTLTLLPWGKLQGRLQIGTKAGMHETLGLLVHGGQNALNQSLRYDYSARTDAAGAFAFDRVPPGWLELGYLTEVADSTWTLTGRTAVNVKPGAITEIQLGGSGRLVKGRFLAPENLQKLAGFGSGLRALVSPNAALRTGNYRHFQFKIHKDGTFAIPDVPPGEYDMSVQIEELTANGPSIRATFESKITVPAMQQGEMDLGTLVLVPADIRTVAAPTKSMTELAGSSGKML
jgi:beta-lactamase regulating signal transducer with metallopeptidase domain